MLMLILLTFDDDINASCYKMLTLLYAYRLSLELVIEQLSLVILLLHVGQHHRAYIMALACFIY